jgi:hypothetical protein
LKDHSPGIIVFRSDINVDSGIPFSLDLHSREGDWSIELGHLSFPIRAFRVQKQGFLGETFSEIEMVRLQVARTACVILVFSMFRDFELVPTKSKAYFGINSVGKDLELLAIVSPITCLVE